MDLPLAGDLEVELPLVDVRRQHLDPHPPAVVDVFDEELVPLGAVHLGGEHGGHELGRVVGLEVGRLIGDQGIGGAVRLVEAVAAEVLDQVEDLGRPVPLQALRATAPLMNWSRPWAMTSVFFFEIALIVRIRLGELDASQAVEDPHDLLLVDHHAVGLFQDLLEDGVEVDGLLAAVLDVDVFVDHAAVQRAGAIEGVGGDDVGEAVGLHLDQEVADAGRFELEDALGLAALEELEGLGVVEREAFEVDRGVGMPLVDEPDRRGRGW